MAIAMNQLNENVKTFLDGLDIVELEQSVINNAEQALYSIVLEKSVIIRHNIKPKLSKSGDYKFTFKRGLESAITDIYCWCGFKQLQITINYPIKVDQNYKILEKGEYVTTYLDTNPGWVNLKNPIIMHPYWTIGVNFTLNRDVSDLSTICVKQLFISADNNQYNNFSKILQDFATGLSLIHPL